MKTINVPQFDPDRCNELAGHIVELLWPELSHFDAPPVAVPTIAQRARESSHAYNNGLSNGEGCVATLIALQRLEAKVLAELCRLRHNVEVDEDGDELAA